MIMADLPHETITKHQDQAALKGLGARKLRHIINDDRLRWLAATVMVKLLPPSLLVEGIITSFCSQTSDVDLPLALVYHPRHVFGVF